MRVLFALLALLSAAYGQACTRYEYAPQPDITIREGMQARPARTLIENNADPCQVAPIVAALPDAVKRHFREVLP